MKDRKPKNNIFKELKVTLDLELYNWKSYLLRMRIKKKNLPTLTPIKKKI